MRMKQLHTTIILLHYYYVILDDVGLCFISSETTLDSSSFDEAGGRCCIQVCARDFSSNSFAESSESSERNVEEEQTEHSLWHRVFKRDYIMSCLHHQRNRL